MQTVDEFMNDYFRERTAEIEREIKRKSAFRERYFAEECNWDQNKGQEEVSRSEEIIRVWHSNSKVYVVTRRRTALFPDLRYHLQEDGGSWLIRCVEIKCGPDCGGPTCNHCNGKGWTGRGDDPDDNIPEPEQD